MKKPKEIYEFIKEICNDYSIYLPACLNDCWTYQDFDEEEIDDFGGLSKYFNDDVIDPDLLNSISIALSVDVKDIVETNYDAAHKIYFKYPFFTLLNQYEKLKYFETKYKFKEGCNVREKLLFLDEFDSKNATIRYSPDNLIERLNEQLVKYDKFVPGTFHPNGEITNFHHSESVVIDFTRYKKMMRSFFEIYDRMVSLFFKALKTNLLQEEIKEYNLFVSYFRANEWVGTDLLYYKNICNHRELYISEGYHDFESYARINRLTTDFEPWICKQFADYPEYAQRYQDIYPSTKKKVLDFCMKIENIWCSYVWSDDPFVSEEPDFYIPLELLPEPRQEINTIYIPKTAEELGEDVKYVDLLSKYVSLESEGGLKRKKTEIEYNTYNVMKRMELRFNN